MRIERKIGKGGAITVPANVRRELGIEGKEKVELSVTDDGKIIVERVVGRCVFCSSDENLKKMKRHFVCAKCLDEMNNL